MKFSIKTTNVSLAALIIISTSHMLEASPVADDNKSNVSSSSSSSVSHAAFQHQIVRLSENNKKRLLQENTTCEQAYDELHNNTQLLEFSEPYRDNYFASVAVDEASILASCNVNENGMACDFRQSVPGQDGFELACTDLGAKIVSFDYSINCDMMADGNATSWDMQFTEAVECVPADCEDEILAVIGKAADSFGNVLESSFLNTSKDLEASSVECGVGSDTDTESGNNTEPGDDTDSGTDPTSGAASVRSKTMLSVLIMAVLSIILPAI